MFSRPSATQHVPGDVKQSDDSFVCHHLEEVVKSKSLPLVRDDRPRYSPSPMSVRRVPRSPCTPPPAVRRPVRTPASPLPSSRLAWESLRAPADVPPPSPGSERAGQAPAQVHVAACVDQDLLPEPEYLYRRFVGESLTTTTHEEDTTSETDDVDESSIHDIPRS